jgi:hypothetical protein
MPRVAQPFIPGPGDGLPGSETLLGSGRAIPAGIEAVLEYNGLFLNVQKNIDQYRVTEIDGLGDPDIRDTRDVRTGSDGEVPYNSFYGGRTIVINGNIQTFNVAKLRDMQMALRTAFADLSQEKPLIFRTGDPDTDHYINCKKISPIQWAESQQSNMVTRDFQISLRASDPRFFGLYANSESFYPGTIDSLTEVLTAVNEGNYNASPVIRFYGPSLSSSLWNDTTQQLVKVNFVPSFDYYEYDLAANTLKNSFGINSWKAMDDASEMMVFAPGPNKLFYQGNSPQVEVFWRDSYI